MRETKNLKLTQFDPNDVPNWLDQYNSDMVKVDTAVGEQKTENSKYELRFTADEKLINNNRTQINENTQDIANVKDEIKNIKGGSTTSIASLQAEVTTVSQSLTTLKGGSDRTIAELENDLNTDNAEIKSLDSRVETLENTTTTLETKVGTASVSNFGNSLTEAIGNEVLADKLTGKNVSEILKFLTSNSVHLEGSPEDTSTIQVSATIDYFPVSIFFAVGIINLTAIVNAGGATIPAGTKSLVKFNLEQNKIPYPNPSHIFLGSLYDFLPPKNESTSSDASLTLDIFSGGAVIRTNVHNGNFIVSEKTISNYKIPVIIPCNPLKN